MVTGPITRGARFLLVTPGRLVAIGSEPQVLLLLLPLMYGFELIVSPTPRWTKHINHLLDFVLLPWTKKALGQLTVV